MQLAQQCAKEAEQCAPKAKQEKRTANIRLAKKMLKYGEAIPDIMQETGLNKQEIESLR